MKILHVVPTLASRTGGPAVAAAELARVAAEAGMEADIYATEMAHPANTRDVRPVVQEELVEGAERATLFPVRSPARLVYSPALGAALRRRVAEYDIVHIHSLYLYPQFAAARAARRQSVPYIVSPHGSLDPWLRRRGRVHKAIATLTWQRRMLAGAAAVHFTTEEEARLASAAVPNGRALVVPLGIRWSRYVNGPPPAHFRRRYLKTLGDGPVVLTLGRLAVKKGLDILIRAFAIAAREIPRASLVIAGPDDEGIQPSLEQLAAHEGIGDRLVFPGMLVGDDKLSALAAADVWALPSHTENFGIAVMEALAAGCPTVVSPAVNLADEIGRSKAGLVRDAEPEPFAEAIASLLHDPARRSELAARAREFARRYDWDALAPGILEMYEGVV